ncbi:MAG: peptidase M19 [Anaerolineales bacterium]|nr:MAG: peptidase M19 [Anaerolineales bacterium]
MEKLDPGGQTKLIVIDAHEDLAWNALTFGRDYRRSVVETRQLERRTDVPRHNGQTLLGWPEWIQGRVAIIFSSLFAAPARWNEGQWDTQCYSGAEQAHQQYRANLDTYLRWADESPEYFRIIRSVQDLESHWAAWQNPAYEGPVGLVLLMEGADGIREPAEVEQWFEWGVRILGPAWAGTRYAGGTKEPGPLTDLGRELIAHMDAMGMILDLSHLSEDGAQEALDRFGGAVLASHTSPLARVPNAEFPERHVSDVLIQRIAERQGVIGLLPANRFLKDGWYTGMDRDLVGMEDIVAAIDHVCQLLGSADHIAFGSDFDGGFGLDGVPKGLDSIADLKIIADGLQQHGYEEQDISGIMGLNWYHLLQRTLPKD